MHLAAAAGRSEQLATTCDINLCQDSMDAIGRLCMQVLVLHAGKPWSQILKISNACRQLKELC